MAPVHLHDGSMQKFLLLLRPTLNQVYSAAARELALAEFQVLSRNRLRGEAPAPRQQTVAGVPYLEFAAEGLSSEELGWISRLSSAQALFRVVDGLLEPLELPVVEVLDNDLVTIPKYRGKTNEVFTKLLVNVALFSASVPADAAHKIRVLDPLCGRGTTLSQALIYGFDATGIDHDTRDCDAYSEFVENWLKRKRMKHKVRHANTKKRAGRDPKRTSIELAPDKLQFREGGQLTLTVINADTSRALELCKRSSFDVIATDMPYGVQHGSRGARGELSRHPLELLKAALPVWSELLRPGGALALAWNTRVASRERMKAAFDECKLELLELDPYEGFKHWVDQAITRDILVARRPLVA